MIIKKVSLALVLSLLVHFLLMMLFFFQTYEH
jgi:hypothetical protein